MYYYFIIICCLSSDRLSTSGVFYCGEFCRLFLTVASSLTQIRPDKPRFRSGSKIEPVHEISNNVVCATGKASDQPAHTRSLIRAFASRLSIL